MKLCVVGAGAIGGFLGARLALAGTAVTLVVRDPARRQAIERDGLSLIEVGGERRVARALGVVGSPAEAGAHDVVILAVKAHQIASLVPGIRALFGPETAVVTLQNGIPWWYFQRTRGPFADRRIAALDPEGAIGAAIEPARLVGAVTYIAGELAAPGVVRHGGGNRLPLGELDGTRSARVMLLSETFARAGIEAPVLDDIRAELWYKAWANACFNPIGALTRATIGEICHDPRSRALVLAVMAELGEVAAKLGVVFRQTSEERLAIAERIARHKTSMLQDVEAGRALEIEAVAGAIVELGRLTATAMSHFEAIYACVKLLDKTMAGERRASAATGGAS